MNDLTFNDTDSTPSTESGTISNGDTDTICTPGIEDHRECNAVGNVISIDNCGDEIEVAIVCPDSYVCDSGICTCPSDGIHPPSEICDDQQLDDNCDGVVDEGCNGKSCVDSNNCQIGLSCVTNGGAKLGATGSVCMPSHCNNDVRDVDETSIYCGGECGCQASIEWFGGIGNIRAISDNGKYIVGYKSSSSISSGYAVYWDSSLTHWELDGNLDEGATSAYGVNANGSIFVGSTNDDGPVRWINHNMNRSRWTARNSQRVQPTQCLPAVTLLWEPPLTAAVLRRLSGTMATLHGYTTFTISLTYLPMAQ